MLRFKFGTGESGFICDLQSIINLWNCRKSDRLYVKAACSLDKK